MHRATSLRRLLSDRRGTTAMEYTLMAAAAAPILVGAFAAHASRFEAMMSTLVASMF